MTDSKKSAAANCCGGLGAVACTVSMLIPVIIGTAGAGASVAGSMAGMSGTTGGSQSIAYFLINRINFAGPAILAVSIGLVLYGMRKLGKLPLALSGFGGVLLYSSMYLLNMSVPLIALSSIVLATAYGTAYLPFIRRVLRRSRPVGQPM